MSRESSGGSWSHPSSESPGETRHTFVLDDAKEVVYSRPEKHGEPEDSFGSIAGFWNAYLNYDEMLDAEDVANMMMLVKIARNKEGHYRNDNYRDIAGYAENGARLYESGASPTDSSDISSGISSRKR